MTRRTDLRTLEEVPRLDVTELVSGGSVGIDKVTVQVEPRGHEVVLRWVRPGGGKVVQRCTLDRYALPFGGTKALIICSCGARVRSVYLNREFLTWGCRFCMGLRYQSQRVSYPRGTTPPEGVLPGATATGNAQARPI